jgi:hypothetical protein
MSKDSVERLLEALRGLGSEPLSQSPTLLLLRGEVPLLIST